MEARVFLGVEIRGLMLSEKTKHRQHMLCLKEKRVALQFEGSGDRDGMNRSWLARLEAILLRFEHYVHGLD
ncbi:unnamed protein product [Dovyalis caffra]|uniref:PH domain-containing protein n=1 Tax=Dovyalis caffra TaxID=77055 RepID=A0AAV1QUH9_9ROSI|nr:unnamed protein product [Dovyalis caffra]